MRCGGLHTFHTVPEGARDRWEAYLSAQVSVTLKSSWSGPPTWAAATLLKLSVTDWSLGSELLSSAVHPC